MAPNARQALASPTRAGGGPPLDVPGARRHRSRTVAPVAAVATLEEVAAHIRVRPVGYAVAKRALDILVATVAIVLLSPILLLAALLVRLTSRGAVIYTQTRVGVGGRKFTCYKFRSMCANADALRSRIRHLSLDDTTFKVVNDPRITPVGRWLRRLSIDELPQLLNVLRGDMSIVGPRPPLPEEVVKYTRHQLGRLSVKPGLTCLWQVSGRSHIGFAHWVELDLLYIDTMSFTRDLSIILRTVPAVLTCRGAY